MKTKILIMLTFIYLFGIYNFTNAYQVTLADGTRIEATSVIDYSDAFKNITWDQLVEHHHNVENGDPGNHQITYSNEAIVCSNGNSFTKVGNTPPPPPPPVISYSSSTSGDSCSYISSWSENWSTCSLNSNWSNVGVATCYQTSSWSPNNSTASWSCTTTTTLVDGVPSGSSTSCNGSCPGNVSKPANRTATKNINISLSNSTSNCNNITYADNNSSCSVRVNISGNTNGGATITGLSGKSITGINNLTNIPSNRIDNNGGNALNFSSVGNTTIQGGGTNYYFDITGIKSLSPFSISNGSLRFNIQGVSSTTNLTLSNIVYGFKKPFTASLGILDDSGNLGSLKIGTQQTAKITPVKVNSLSISNYLISDFSSSLEPVDTVNFLVQNKKNESNLDPLPTVDFTLNYKGSSNITATQIQANPIISYSLGGEEIKYYLNNSEYAGDNSAVKSGDSGFIGVKIVGNSQAIGRQSVTTDKNTFTDISTSSQRTTIKQNIYNLIKGRTVNDNKVINGIKYVSGNKKISELGNDYKTIVLVNGNLTIDQNITSKIGIIVLRDDNSKTSLGNVYVNNDVAYINTVIYADGGFISTGWNTTEDLVSNYQDSVTRNNSLNKQLVLKGSLFTRNTIGGALATGGKYILPGGTKIDANNINFDKAIMYDLNYIRRGNNGYNLTTWTSKYNMGYNNAFIIIYDDSNLKNPPVGF